MQHAATFSAWQVRATCVEALGKIALRSIASADDEQAYLALSVYEFLSATNADDNYGLQLVAAPIVQLMDHLYEAREWLVLKLQPPATTAAGSPGIRPSPTRSACRSASIPHLDCDAFRAPVKKRDAPIGPAKAATPGGARPSPWEGASRPPRVGPCPWAAQRAVASG